MIKLVVSPSRIKADGTPVKVIEEYIGAVNTSTSLSSIAIMTSPQGWNEPGQRPEFDEFSIVLEGTLVAECEDGIIKAKAGQAIIAQQNEWVRYSTPHPGGARYISVCIPAFTPGTVHRDK